MKKEILISGTINKELFASIMEQTQGLTAADEIILKINSNGGNAFDGLAIYDALTALPCKISVEILGVCASAATIVAAAGSTRLMSPRALWMVHRAWVPVCGNVDDLKRAVELLEKIDARMVEIYASITGRTSTEITAAIAADNYMSAETALAGGWVTGISGGADENARAYDDLCEEVKAQLSAPPEAHFTLAELVQRCSNLFRSDAQKQEISATAKLKELQASYEKLTGELEAARAAAAAAQEELTKKEASILEREQLAVAAALKNIGADADSLPPAKEPTGEPSATPANIIDIGSRGGLSAALDYIYRK